MSFLKDKYENHLSCRVNYNIRADFRKGSNDDTSHQEVTDITDRERKDNRQLNNVDQLQYSDTSANEDNSFRNYIR